MKIEPACYAVIFSSQLKSADDKGYAQMAAKMEELARQQPGFVGIESVRSATGQGITVSYWQTLESISEWKKNTQHLEAQNLGQNKWYANYSVKIAKIERSST